MHVNLKLEKGRKGHGGVLHGGAVDREPVAQQLMAESACTANTPGGGALIVGVARPSPRPTRAPERKEPQPPVRRAALH